MENGMSNGAWHTNHERDHGRDRDAALGQGAMNGFNAAASQQPDRMNDLPGEIQHVTSNFIPLALLLERLAQKTHNNLQDVIREMARKPLPGHAAKTSSGGGGGGMEANGAVGSPGMEDGSIENVEKKKALLDFAQREHANWVKALVITEWSKKAKPISKLIDLENHMFEEELVKYEQAVFTMLNLKRNLNAARVPNPDLKTALQVLSQGTAPWMPDLGFLDAPPLTAREKHKWLSDISALLSLRMNLDEHDTLPYHFRDYSIASGRVTFRVPHEFEVDLTIASDDFTEQFWFLDLRFLFAPAPAALSDTLRKALEDRVNGVLASEGLAGCYRCLHEYVLTHKVNELRRQAVELGRGPWIETLKIEPLNRALSIQYWASRYTVPTMKSWFLVGVHSGRTDAAVFDEKATSRLAVRWFRNSKEVKDVEIPVAEVGGGGLVSTEKLLRAVVGLHIEHILSSIYHRLLAKPLYAKRQAAMRLHICKAEPGRSVLELQLINQDWISVRIDPVSGLFAMLPLTETMAKSERYINNSNKDPVEDGVLMLETVRSLSMQEELGRRAKSFGWTALRGAAAVAEEELRQVINLRDTFQVLWLKRHDWDPHWRVLACLSLSGDFWWIVKLTNPEGPSRIQTSMKLSLGGGPSKMSAAFFSDLTVFATGIISQYVDIQELARRKVPVTAVQAANLGLAKGAKLPALKICLSDLLPSQKTAQRSGGGGVAVRNHKSAWATDFVLLVFAGIDMDDDVAAAVASSEAPGGGPGGRQRLGVLCEARLMVVDRSQFELLGGRRKSDRNVSFNAQTGQFCLHLRAEVGQSAIETLVSRLQTIDRLVGFLGAVQREKRLFRCESATLRRLVFSYGGRGGGDSSSHSDSDSGSMVPAVSSSGSKQWPVVVELVDGDQVHLRLERGCPHLRVVDFLNQVARDPHTFMSVPFFLDLTLSLHVALDRIEDTWEPIHARGAGMLGVFPRSLDRTVLRILIPNQLTRARQLVLEIRMRSRRGESLWQIRRIECDPALEDDFTKALKRVFDGRGRGWKGLATAAVASPFCSDGGGDANNSNGNGKNSNWSGIEECLAELDESIRSMIAMVPPNMTQAQLQQRRAAQAAQAAAQAQLQAHAQAQLQAQHVQTPRMG